MSSLLPYLIAGLFLPLYPLSIPLNFIYSRIRQPLVRTVLLLVWPQFGLQIITTFNLAIPNWVITWALITSLLYAIRALTLREIGVWTCFIATSSWTLLWILLANDTTMQQMKLITLGISIPLVLLAFLGVSLERRFGAAYMGLYGGLAQTIPRFSGVLVIVVLAIIATPLFPTFFAMLMMIVKTALSAPMIAFGVAIVWLLWSWAGTRLLQGLIVGNKSENVADLCQAKFWFFIVSLLGLLCSGVYWLGMTL